MEPLEKEAAQAAIAFLKALTELVMIYAEKVKNG